MSPGLAIVLIIVVWLLVLAPVLLRGQKPMSRTGEAFDDTRVLFEGDSGVLESNRGPKLSAKAARIKARKESDAAKAKAQAEDASAANDSVSVTTSEEYAQLGDVKAEKQTIAGAAARIKSEYDNVASAETAEATESAATAEPDTAADNSVEAETIEGEIVYEVDTIDTKDSNGADGADSADVVDAEFADADLASVEAEKQKTQADKPKADAVPASAVLVDDDAELLDEEDDILLEDEPREESKAKPDDSEYKKTSVVAASEGQVFTAPAAYALADDAYDLDDTYLSPVDMMYPGAVDSDLAEAEETTSSHQDNAVAADSDNASSDPDNIDNIDNDAGADAGIDAEESVQQPVEVAEYDDEFEDSYVAPGSDNELSEEELEFAQARVGRGGWDPEADAANKATRYQRRQRTLFGLALVVVLTVALGIVFGGWLWWTAAVAGGLTIAYLVALRTQVRQEQQLRARRIAQLRRARLGVRSAEDEELAIPRSLRRPGAVIVEIDDSSPDWDHLPEVYEEVEEAPQRPSQRRQRRDDLAARRVG